MRILHAVNNVTRAGNGISNVAVDLAVEQRRQGHDVFIASAGGPSESNFLDLLAEHAIQHFDVDFRIRRPVPVARAYRTLVAVFRETQPEIVHTHTLTPTVLGYLATRRRCAALVATVHNEYQRGVRLMGLADRVVGVSEAVSQAMARRGVPRNRICTVRNGTVGSLRWPPITDEQWVDLPPQSIVTVGAVSHRKGADVLLRAYEEVLKYAPRAHLYYVGHVDWSDPLDIAGSKPWSDQVHFVGFQAQPQRYLKNASVFVLASRRDPMPLVLLEALEAGLPVVASDVDGIPEALDEGKAGILVRASDATALARGIIRLLQSNKERSAFARAARERAAAFTVHRMAAEYIQVYQTAVSR